MKLSKFRDYYYPFFLVLISVFLFLVNYKSGTWLSGWDTLHPEMNFAVYWQRIFESVWQEHQGLGAVATQAHASEIPRIFIMEILDIFFPAIFLRWLYFGLMLIAGPLGIYFLAKNLSKDNKNTDVIAFSAGAFYLLNLGTLQNFYVPLEMFVTLYGFIGWLFLYFIKCIHSLNRKDFYIFALLTLFASPMAHTPTLWFVYFFFLNLFGIGYLLEKKLAKEYVKSYLGRFILLSITTLFINLYWILPTTYFVLNHSESVATAKITRLVSEEGILNNQEYANFSDIAVLKGYLFNWRVHRGDGFFSPIFINWEDYYYASKAMVYGYFFFGIIILSFIISSIKKKLIPVSLLLLFSFFFLLMDSPPLGFLFSYIQENNFLFREALRFPYTKFSIPLMLAYSIFFGFGLDYLIKFTGRFLPAKAAFGTVPIFLIALVLFMLPAFKGDLIGDIEKVKIPDEYFETFDYLNQYSDIRIATLPVNTLFGWNYYDWIKNDKIDPSYQGAGFTWFLSGNPILEREFDRWYPTNEDFYNEFQYAVYSENAELVDFLIQKYDIDYIVFDKNIISSDREGALFYTQLDTLLSDSALLKLDKIYGEIKLYRSSTFREGFVEIPRQYRKTQSYDFSNVDSNSAGYITSYSEPIESENYPLADDNELAESIASNGYVEIPLPAEESADYLLSVPSYISSGELFPMTATTVGNNQVSVGITEPSIQNKRGEMIYHRDNTATINLSDGEMLYINGYVVDPKKIGESELIYDKNENFIVMGDLPVYTQSFSEHIYSAEPTDCAGGRGGFGKKYGARPGYVTLSALDRNVCLEFDVGVGNILPVVYKVSFYYKNTSGAKPLFCLANASTKECINNKYKHSPVSSEEMAYFEGYLPITASAFTNLSLIMETEDKKEVQEVEYGDIKIELFEIKRNVALNASFGQPSQNIPVKVSDFPLKVTIPDSVADITYTPQSKAFGSSARNCDNFNYGNIDRVIEESDRGSYFLYSSVDAISCDVVSPYTSDTRLGYVVSFDSENLSGKALDICIDGHEFEKCLVTDRLKGKGPQAFVLPPYKSSSTFSIGIGSQSIGNIATKNRLYAVSIGYLPYFWLKGLKVMPGAESTAVTAESGLSLKKALKTNIYRYVIDLENSLGGGEGLLVLRQSYEHGWHLYRSENCFIGIVSRFTCRPIGRHIVADNWANGWIVTEKGSYIILYEPQYWQFTGYLFLAIIAVIGPLLSYRPRVI